MLSSNNNDSVSRVLVADDQQDVLEALRLLLKAEGYQTETATSPRAILEAMESSDFDVLLMDLNYARDTTSGQEGLDLLRRIQALDSTLPVIVMTAWGSVELAVEAMRHGARDFVQKPWDNARLLSILRTQIELGQALRKGQLLEAENQVLRDESRSQLVAESSAMQPVRQVIARVGPSDANVLITGENGTGKGVVAQTIHAVSKRASRPMVTVNVGGLSEGVFESELFGHVKGAFTSATNADISEEVSAGRVRQDLLYRLNTVEIHLPSLRERPEDIPILAMSFAGEIGWRGLTRTATGARLGGGVVTVQTRRLENALRFRPPHRP